MTAGIDSKGVSSAKKSKTREIRKILRNFEKFVRFLMRQAVNGQTCDWFVADYRWLKWS